MDKNQLKYVKEYELIEGLIDGPYNPPTIVNDSDEEQYENEYEGFRDKVILCLSNFSEIEKVRDSNNAWSVGHRTGLTRGLGVVLSSKKLMNPRLLGYLKKVVDEYDENYVIAISGEHKLGEDFYIALTKDEMLCHADNKKWLKPFGLS